MNAAASVQPINPPERATREAIPGMTYQCPVARLRIEATLAAVSGLCMATAGIPWTELAPERIAKRAVNIANAVVDELNPQPESRHECTR